MSRAATTVRRTSVALAMLASTACSREASEPTLRAEAEAPLTTTTVPRTTSTTALATTTTAAPTTTTPPTTSTTVLPAPAPGSHPARVVHEQAWTPFATVRWITLHHPSDRVEAIGFHQSTEDGAQPQVAAPGAARWFLLPDRGRDTSRQGAADVVVEPGREIRSPVTGTVIEAGTYTLYCDNVDQFAVIEPDAHPGWQVKVLHVEGLALVPGQRVQAGVTRLAAQARVLPFPSQVEDDTGLPAWPHVHIEVIDPTVPDRPTGPGCP